MPSELIVLNFGYAISIILNVCLGIAVMIKGSRKGENITFFLASICLSVFSLAYVFGVNVKDPHFSRFILLFTMVNIFTVCLNAHFIFYAIGKAKEHTKGIIAMYATGLVLFLFYISNTSLFLIPSRSKLYLPNYFEVGKYYWLFNAYFFLIFIYFLYYLIKEYLKADPITKNRLQYYIFAFGFAYTIGSIAFLLEYNVPVDPLISMFVGFYTIPLAYGIMKYDLMDIHVAFKRSLIYAFFTFVTTLILIGINFFSNYISSLYVNFPIWIIPASTSVVAIFIGAMVWYKIKEVDVLKYEFINNVTHKFRTPITHIKWLTEELKAATTPEERDNAVAQIQYSSMRLFELTNILIDLARNDTNEYLYTFEKGDLEKVLNDTIESHKNQIEHKNLKINVAIQENIPAIVMDYKRMQVAIQILFENAVAYTPSGGTIVVAIKKDNENLLFSIKDNGIGIPKEEIAYLFSKFYRSRNARHVDTEGMGIGLFMAKNIIMKHHGKIWVESEGENKGATFYFTLPLA